MAPLGTGRLLAITGALVSRIKSLSFQKRGKAVIYNFMLIVSL